jgi:hypothetical protein
MGFPSRFSVFKKTKNMKSKHSPLGASLSASMVPDMKAKYQAKFKRLKPKRLITECADEDDTDDDDLFLVDAEKPSGSHSLLSRDCDTFSVPSDGVKSDVTGMTVACASTRSPLSSFSALCGTASSFGAPPPLFLTNKELADRIYEMADMLLKGIASELMKTINKLTHLSKTYTASKVKVVNRFFTRSRNTCWVRLFCVSVLSLKLLIKKMGATARYRLPSKAKTNLWGSTNLTGLRPKLECSLVG